MKQLIHAIKCFSYFGPLQVFGIDLRELEGKQKAYILVNMLENDVDKEHLMW